MSILRNIRLSELIAQTPEQYVQIAAGLANDLPRLSELRRTLRGRMQESVLMDAPRSAQYRSGLSGDVGELVKGVWAEIEIPRRCLNYQAIAIFCGAQAPSGGIHSPIPAE